MDTSLREENASNQNQIRSGKAATAGGPLIVRLEVGGRGRRVDRAHQLRSGGDVRRPFIADRGRPGPVDTVGPDGIDGKIGFCATLSSPQRQRALPPQPVPDRSPAQGTPPEPATASRPPPRARSHPPRLPAAAPARQFHRRPSQPRSPRRRMRRLPQGGIGRRPRVGVRRQPLLDHESCPLRFASGAAGRPGPARRHYGRRRRPEYRAAAPPTPKRSRFR